MNTKSKPRIIVSSLDAERLEDLIDSLHGSSIPGKDQLEAELERAEVVDPKDVPPTVVTMNSTVRFKVENSNEEFRSEEHTSELQSRENLVCRLLLEKKNNRTHRD